MSRVVRVFSEVLGVDPSQLNDDSSPDNVSTWDSLASMSLVAAVEEEFKLRLSTREIAAMRTIRLVRDILTKKGALDV